MSAPASIPAGGTSAPMHTDGVHWEIRLSDGRVVNSDEFTLDEVERLERLTDVAWALLNPLASLKQAKAWLLVAALHAGASEDEAASMLAGLNLRGIKSSYQLAVNRRRPLRAVEPDDDDEVPPVPPQ